MSVNAETAASAAEGSQHGVPDPKRWLALAVIAVAQLLIILDATVVTVALPAMQKSLHISCRSPRGSSSAR
jgi:hypothetical protein